MNTRSTDIRSRFESALSAFVDKIKSDPNILAVILCGSLANDTVWEKSDMDTYVLVREMKLPIKSYCIEEDGLIINVNLQSEFDFKRGLERSLGGGMWNSMFAKARVVYSKDDSLHNFLAGVQKLGKDDMALSFFQQATYLIGDMEKIEKWLTVKDDPLYAQLWVLKAADMYANMCLALKGDPPNREAVLKVMEYAPEMIKPVYERPMQGPMTREEIWDALRFYRKFLEDNIDLLKLPVVNYMSDGEVRTVTTLVKHFRSDSHGMYHIFDFLEEMGVVARVTETVRITPKSRRAVEEVAFVYIAEERGSE
ncbi:MAG: nucleotidyltransferase domain-containing protein [Firmicutes bacterium]|nr:nucleotidyltransferase domain-containing protein [Bacillota bacterium]